MEGKDPAWLKKANSATLLKTIFSAKQISRKDLATVTGLTPGAVTRLISELIEAGIVCETGIDTQSKRLGGPTPRFLSISDSFPYVLAIHIGTTTVALGLFTLSAKSSGYLEEHFYTGGHNLSELLEDIQNSYEQLLEKSGIPAKDIVAAGIDIGGYIDTKTGTVKNDKLSYLNEIDLAAVMEKQLGLNVYINNIVHSLAMAENLLGEGKNADSFALIYIGGIVGVSLCIDGKIISGHRGLAGHGLMNTRALLAVTDDTLISRATELLQTTTDISCLRTTLLEKKRLTREDMNASAEDPLVWSLCEERGNVLGRLVADIINLVDPEKIVIYAPLTILPAEYQIILQTCQKNLNSPENAPEILIPQRDRTQFILGAATLAIQNLFSI